MFWLLFKILGDFFHFSSHTVSTLQVSWVLVTLQISWKETAFFVMDFDKGPFPFLDGMILSFLK